MGREDNIRIFRDTERICSSNEKIKESIKTSVAGQKLILESDDLPEQKKELYEEKANVIVSQKRTFEAAMGYAGQKVAVLNFASASNPGGGVQSGAGAQEECLCRCSGLFFCLSVKEMMDGFYNPHRQEGNPLHNDDIIYTPGVTVFKTDTSAPLLMPKDEWYDVDVITCAAPNLRAKPSNKYNTGDGSNTVVLSDQELLDIHEKKLRRILEVALMERNDTVILGAFGCGAFCNDPKIVARAESNVISDYLHAFRNIEFAIYCPPNDLRNYKSFLRVLKQKSSILRINR